MSTFEFHEGDFVQRNDGAIGYVESVCHCSECEKRGFFEPTIKYLNDETEYLSNYDAKNIENSYIQIGTHIFTENTKTKKNHPKYSLIGEITYKDVEPDIVSNALLDVKNHGYIPVLREKLCNGENLYWILKKEES